MREQDLREKALTDDQFWALERWIIAHASAASMPPGFHDPARLLAIRDTAYVALTGRAALSTPPQTVEGSEEME